MIDHLQLTRADLAQKLAALEEEAVRWRAALETVDRLIADLGPSAVRPRSVPAPARARAPKSDKPARPRTARPAKPAKPAANGCSARSPRKQAARGDFLATCGQCEEPFTVDMVRTQLGDGATANAVAALLRYHTAAGRLVMVRKSGNRGQPPALFRRGPNWHPTQAEPLVESSQAAKHYGFSRGKQSPARDAVLQLFEEQPGPLAVQDIVDEIRKRAPQLTERLEQVTALRVLLLDMANEGKLVRMGSGRNLHYSAPVKRPAPNEDEAGLDIRVPRDPEVGA